MQFKNQVIIIFGGNGKLGRSLVKEVVRNGGLAISIDSSYKHFAFKKISKNFYIVNCNLLKKKSLENLKEAICKKFKRIDAVVNAITTKTKDFYYPLKDLSIESWSKILNSELTISFLISQIFGEYMSKNKKGNLVFMSSIYGMVGNDHEIYRSSNLPKVYSDPNQRKNIFSNIAYSVSKGGIISLTKFLASYWVGKNIRVNCISAGGVFNKKENKIFLKNYTKKVPLRRKANVDEIVDAIIFLLSKKSKYINGHNLVVDGGYTIW